MNFIKNRFFSVMLALILSIICLTIWYFGSYLKWYGEFPLTSMNAKLMLMGIVCIFCGLLYIPLLIIRLRTNQVLIESLLKIPEDKLSDDYRKYQYFTKVLRRAMKKSFISKDGLRIRISSLPWYVVIGAPGAGKSTLIQKSGLHFPLGDALGEQALAELKRFRRFEWWLTDHGVFVEIYREITENPEDLDWQSLNSNREWQETLMLIKKIRGRASLNGIILVADAPSIFNKVILESEMYAKAGLQRVNDIQSLFHQRLPVYLMITKCDLLAGFTDYFSAKHNNLTTAFGITFDGTKDIDELSILKRGNALISLVKEKFLSSVSSAATVQESQAAYEFIRNFPLLIQNIAKLLVAAITKSNHQWRNVRGVFFCSALEGAGTVTNPVLQHCAESLAISFLNPTLFSADERKRFVNGFFEEVIYTERNLIHSYTRYRRIKTKVRKFLNLILILIALAVGSGLMYSYFVVNRALHTVYRNVRQFNDFNNLIANSPPPKLDGIGALQDIIIKVSPLDKARSLFDVAPLDNIALPLWPSLDLLQQPIVTLEKDYLARNFLPLIMMQFNNVLINEELPIYKVIESMVAYKRLKEDYLNHKLDVNNYLHSIWKNPPYSFTDKSVGSLISYLNLLADQQNEFAELNPESYTVAVNRIRSSLISDIAYQKLHDHIKAGQFIKGNLAKTLGHDYEIVFDAQKLQQIDLSLFYTRSVYSTLFLPMATQFTREIVADLEYLHLLTKGASQEAIFKTVEHNLQIEYYDDYADSWSGIVEMFQLAKVNEINALSKQLEVLSRIQSPLKNYLEFLSGNTNYTIQGTNQPISFANVNFLGIIEALKSDKKSISKYALIHNDIIKVSAYVDNIRYSADPDKTAYLQLRAFIDGKNENNPVRTLIRDSYNTPKPLQDLLMQLSNNITATLRSGAWRHVQSVWNSDIQPGFENAILSRYPFTTSTTSVKTEDFNHYFADGGVLSSFYATYLDAFIDKKQSNWEYRKVLGAELTHDGVFLEKMNTIDKIRRGLFANQSKQMKVSMTIKPYELDPNAAELQLKYGDVAMIYRHGPSYTKEFTWPGVAANNSLSIQICGFKDDFDVLEFNDQWSWLKFLERGKITSKISDNHYLFTLKTEGHSAVLELTTDTPLALLDLSLFRSLPDKDFL